MLCSCVQQRLESPPLSTIPLQISEASVFSRSTLALIPAVREDTSLLPFHDVPSNLQSAADRSWPGAAEIQGGEIEPATSTPAKVLGAAADTGVMDPSDPKVPSPVDLDGDWGRFRQARSCTDCRTTKTPLWRGGPSGPKSLCNACGIRYRKRRRELLGLQLGGGQRGKKERSAGSKVGVLRLLGLNRDVVLNPGDLIRLKQRCLWRRLDEEEKAAVLLMALSSGHVGA